MPAPVAIRARLPLVTHDEGGIGVAGAAAVGAPRARVETHTGTAFEQFAGQADTAPVPAGRQIVSGGSQPISTPLTVMPLKVSGSGHVEMRYDAEQRRVVYQPVTIEPREITPRIIREDNYGGLH